MTWRGARQHSVPPDSRPSRFPSHFIPCPPRRLLSPRGSCATIDAAVCPRDELFELVYVLCEFSRFSELVWRWNCCSSCCSSPLATLAGRAPSSNFSRPHPSAERQKRAKQTWMDRLHGAIISFSFSRLFGFVTGGEVCSAAFFTSLRFRQFTLPNMH